VEKRYIVLDRDGVINTDSDHYIRSADEFIPLPRSLSAIARLNRAGYSVLVATNQSGIGRGYFSLDTLQQMHKKLEQLLAKEKGSITEIFYCPHIPKDQCDCRKPKAGLLWQIQKTYPVVWEDTFLVGDSWRDMQAALAVKAKAVLLKTGKGKRTIKTYHHSLEKNNIAIFADLSAFVDHLLGKES
jgi:D-glycero-D-manno-heptose 1,7-bisphosphate phosphatase